MFDNVGKNLDPEAGKRTAASLLLTILLIGLSAGGITAYLFFLAARMVVEEIQRFDEDLVELDIEEIDAATASATVLAGTPLETLQKAADEAGFFFALDIGARGSCTIGGNLGTNAGGNRVLRYGMARDLVLGLEAVLPDGTVLSSLNKMLKNNTGVDLKQIFIGTEGIFGVITRAVDDSPSATAREFCIPLTQPSWIRLTRNTS